MTQEEQIWNESFKKSHIGKETQPPIVKYRQVVEENENLNRELEIVKAERDELQKEYETLIIEKAELSKNYTQIGENLSYYIKLADDFQKERDMWRDNFINQNDEIDKLKAQLIEKLTVPYSIEYVQQLKNQVKGLEETVADLKQELKQYYS